MICSVVFNVNNEKFMNTLVESLEMSSRTTNALRRNGFQTVGDIVNKFDSLIKMELVKFGATSEKELNKRLVEYYCDCLEPDQLVVFLADFMTQGVKVTKSTKVAE